MSNLENINDKLPAAGPENKPVRRSSRLQEKSEQKGQVDYLPTVSHPDQTEALDVGSPTSEAHNGVLLSSENYQSFKQQLNKSEFDKNNQHSYMGNYSQHTIHENVQANRHKQSLDFESSLEVENLDIEQLTKLVAQARILEKKAILKKELNSIYNRLDEGQNKFQSKISYSGSSPVYNSSHTVGATYNSNLKHRTLENCKLFSQIEAIGDPVIELRFFEDRCNTYGITDDTEKFEILQRIWPRPDIIDFFEAYDEDRTYFNLFKFLEGKGSKLPKILGPHPTWEGPVKFQNLYLSAKKWAKSNEQDRIKYFMYVHAPDKLKKKIKENFGLSYEEFLRHTESICEIEEQRVVEQAKHVSYEPHKPYYGRNRSKRHNNVGWQENQNLFHNNHSSNQPNQNYCRLEGTNNGRVHYNYKTQDNNHNVNDYHPNHNISKVNGENDRKVKHCNFATTKTPSVHSTRKAQKLKLKAPRKIITYGVTGRVVWFNVKKGYGFIHCDNKDSDVFVHHTEITKNNPNKFLRSLAQGEAVEFDVVMSERNLPQAVNVTGPNNKPDKGSKYAQDRWPSYNQRVNRQQRPQQKCYFVNDYYKVREKQQREEQNCYEIKHNHQLTHQVQATDDRQFAKESTHTNSPNDSLKISSTGYQPISNEQEQVEPQSEILKLISEKDELIKEGLKIEENVESIKLKIDKLRNKVLDRLT